MEEEFTKKDLRKLRKKDLTHLIWTGITTKTKLRRALGVPGDGGDCFDCRHIGRVLGMERK